MFRKTINKKNFMVKTRGLMIQNQSELESESLARIKILLQIVSTQMKSTIQGDSARIVITNQAV
jgi:hypothetical protein